MSQGKETPRQKMIGMMYLVLMAMLALNVSKDVLNAFVLVDEGLTSTTGNFAKKNDVYYQEFDRAAAENPVKAGPWQVKALEVKRRADELHQYLQDLKYMIVIKSEGEDTHAIHEGNIHGGLILGKDNVNLAAEIMIGADGGGRANDLKMAIGGFREHLISIISEENETIRTSIESNLATEERMVLSHGKEEKQSWEISIFDQMPLIAVITLMSKMQNDVRNSESETLAYLYGQIDAGSFKFNLIEPVIIPKSNHVIQGNDFEASVFMAAFDTTQEPIVYIGAYDSTVSDDGIVEYKMIGTLGTDFDTIPVTGGKGVYKIRGSSLGEEKWGGIIALKRMDGSYTNKPFSSSYTVAPPALVVSPTEMNVFYNGIDNPVEISVPGYPANAIRASINNGRMPGSGTRWTASPNRLGTAKVSVSVMIDGVSRSMGTKEFRVEPVPPPRATLGGRIGGTLRRSEVLSELGLKAQMPEYFKFGGVSFQITSYEFEVIVQNLTAREIVTGANFTPAVRDYLRNVRAGSNTYFTNIKAVGPDGGVVTLPPLVIKIR